MMNRFTLTLGALLTVLASGLGLVFVPNWHYQGLKPHVDEDGKVFPVAYYGEAKKGREVYAELGCIYCHSQQVRAPKYGADIDRGWGTRRSVARDYIYDDPPFLGTMRTGPDLANIGARQTSRDWHALHLYNPQLTSPGSIMPPHRFLFERFEPNGNPVPHRAIALPAKPGEKQSYILPSDRGEALIAYLKSLDHSYPLPEAK